MDFETFGGERIVVYCCCLLYNNKFYAFYGKNCVDNLIQYIFKTCSNETIIYAHNLTFDGSLLIERLPKDVKLTNKQTLIIKGDIYSLRLEKNNIKIVFKCSYKLMPMSLGDIGKTIGIEKINMDHSLVGENNYMDKDLSEKVIKYCKRDVEITQYFLKSMYASLSDVAINWRYYTNSISGISLAVFKKCFKNKGVVLSIEKSLDIAVRPAYYGGRCEVFGNPFDDDFIFHYDFSGMYTNRLKEEYPCDNPEFIEKIEKIVDPGFYSISVESDGFYLPVLPYRLDKLVFANGFFSGVYWYEEIDLFVKNGGIIKKIHWGYVYKKKKKIFEEFAEYCKYMRSKNKVSKVLWKTIPNSFIGRMGIKNEYEKTEIIDEKDYDPRQLNVISDKKINTKYIVRHKTINISKKKTESNVCYAAITTSKARIVWWKAAIGVISNGGRLLYCDTDSLFVAYKKDVLNEKHGDVFWDGSKSDTRIKEACFATSKAYSIKTYENEEKTKIKGIPKNSISYEDFKKTFYSEKKKEIKTSQFKRSNLNIKIVDVNKVITMGEYDKREFSENKKTTKPIYINT